MIQEIFKMLNQYEVDFLTLPVNPVSFPPHPVMGRQAFGTHMTHRETFLQIQLRLLLHLIRRNSIHGVLICRNQFTHQRRRRMRIKHQFKIRDASPDRQPKIHSSPVREILQRIMGQTNNDCRFRISTLTSSLRQQRLLAGR